MTPRWLTKPEIATIYGKQMPIRYLGQLGTTLYWWGERGLVRRRAITTPSSKARVAQAKDNGVRIQNVKFEYNVSDVKKALWNFHGIKLIEDTPQQQTVIAT